VKGAFIGETSSKSDIRGGLGKNRRLRTTADVLHVAKTFDVDKLRVPSSQSTTIVLAITFKMHIFTQKDRVYRDLVHWHTVNRTAIVQQIQLSPLVTATICPIGR
jgi:hypothetical protein